MATTKTNWQPNEKQKAFLNALKEADGGLTLAEVSKSVGMEIKSGSINTLIAKGMVQTEDVSYECNIVRKDNGEVVGSTKKTVKAYKLVGQSDQTEGLRLFPSLDGQTEGVKVMNMTITLYRQTEIEIDMPRFIEYILKLYR